MTTPASTTSTIIAEDALRSALSASKRPKRPNALSASLTFGWRAMLKIKHVPEQLFDAVFNPILFTLLFTYLLGGAIAGSTGAYLQFLLPGILVQTVVMITAYTGVNLNTDNSKGIADRFRSLPVWRASVIVGALFGDVVRYTLSSTIVLGLGVGARLPSRGRRDRSASRGRARHRVRVQYLLDLDDVRTLAQDAELCIVGEYADTVHAHLRQQHLR